MEQRGKYMSSKPNRLTPDGYLPRLTDARLDMLMGAFGCVEITGPKWCGKTWSALSRAASVTELDKGEQRQMAEVDPSLALLGDAPHLVDEWQEVPAVWDAARRFVDDSAAKTGRLLLTGSTQLEPARRGEVHHSGAGRIARLRMRTMTLAELGESTAEVSLRGLFEGSFSPATSPTSVADVARWCCRGGWPAALGAPDVVAFEMASQYIQAVLDDNVMQEGLSADTALAVLRSLALNSSRAATKRTLIRDMGARGVSVDTLTSYVGLFERLYLVEELAGWEPPLRAKARVRVSPKRYFTDPSLAAALLGATPERLVRDTQTLGDLFESLVLRDLRVFLSTYPGLGNSVHYYRDDKGLEVDVVLEHGGRWAAVEVKLSDTKADAAARNLLRLRSKLCANAAAQVEPPAFLAVVVGRGSVAYQREDGVFVIPMATLGS